MKPAQRTRPVSRTQTSRTSRKRAASDENAGIPDLSPAEPIEAPIQPIETVSPGKASSAAKQPLEEDDSLSSRETTPPGSPGPVFEQPKDYTEDKIDAADLEQMDDEGEAKEQSASDDELCGPKTPMKRAHKAQSQTSKSSRSNTRSNSNRQDSDVPAQTPPRRRGARGATPQTQKPQNQTATSESVLRPMTVARAHDRPFVFRKLEKDSTLASDVSAETVDADGKAQEVETRAEEAGDQAQVGDNDSETAELEDEAFESLETDHAQDPEETIVIDEDITDEPHNLELADSPSIDAPTYSYEPEENLFREESSPVKSPVSEDIMDDDDDSSLLEAPVTEYENEDDMEVDSPTAEPPVASYEVDIDGSVIIHSRDGSESGDSSEDEANDYTEFGLKTPRPETIPWQNIREDTTIPIDFDLHFADVRTPARVDDDFSSGAASMFQNLQAGANDVLREQQHHDFDGLVEEPTMNINDFVDIAALSEPTLQLDAMRDGDEKAPEATNTPSEADDTESTVIITKAGSLVPVALELAEGNDGSHDAVQPNADFRSGMMRESLQQFSAANKHIETGTMVPLYDLHDVLEEVDGSIPHYAWSTLSSRRKSLPVLSNQTPVNSDARPMTSDGSSIAHPVDESWWTRSRRSSVVLTNTASTPVRIPSKRRQSSAGKSASVDDQDSHPIVKTPATQQGERFPRRTPKDRYDGQIEAQTVAAPSRFRTPSEATTRYPATVQKLGSQQTRQVLAKEQSNVFTPGSSRKLSRSDETEQAQSFNVPFRFRTQATTPAQRTPITQKGTSDNLSEATNPRSDLVPHATPQERFPRRSARQTYDQQASTAAPPARFHTPIQGKPRRSATVQRLTSQTTSQAESFSRHATSTQKTPQSSRAQKKPVTVTPSAATPQARFPRLPPKETYEVHVDAESKPQPATPQARFPRLPPKQNYNEHASTVIAPSRFRSPAHASPRRPATSQKPVNLRKIALKSAAPGYGSHTPIKTPLKASAETPSQVPMTPHPGAPLRGVVALVEVFTLDGASASAPFISLLQRLGARTTKTWSERVTHVIFKDGSPTTLQRVRLNNKEVETTRKGFIIHCVNSRWVSDCDATGSRVNEDDDAYAVDVTEVPRGGNRRRKSMEPSALVNIGGNIVRDRKSSGRQSIGRSTMKPDSSDKRSENDFDFTPVAKWTGLQDEDDFEDDESELSTPDYLAAPDKLIQMTAPANRVRKLDLQKDASKNRRMTSFWEGGD